MIILFSSCFKDYSVDIVNAVELGETVVYLNGEESTYLPRISSVAVDEKINYGFWESESLLSGENRGVGFSLLPLENGNFVFCENRNDCDNGALTSFGHYVGDDLIGFEYKLANEEEGYFEVTSLDTIQRIVQGRFKVQFKRTSKNGNGDIVKDFPKRLTFEGVFHEEYEVL